jgi:isoleucyl-tRNA synthetase
VLVRLLAPILAYTSEEVWLEMTHDDGSANSVHLADWPVNNEKYIDKKLNDKWEKIIKIRTDVARELEGMRASKQIGNSLEASVDLYTDDVEMLNLLKEYESDFPMIFIVSEVSVSEGPLDSSNKGEIYEELFIKVKVSDSSKCDRCWNYRKEVGKIEKYPTLCNRCSEVIEEVEAQK